MKECEHCGSSVKIVPVCAHCGRDHGKDWIIAGKQAAKQQRIVLVSLFCIIMPAVSIFSVTFDFRMWQTFALSGLLIISIQKLSSVIVEKKLIS
jgi:uncharacterized protein (DUF983 family)